MRNQINASPATGEDSYQQGMTLRDYFAAKAMQSLIIGGFTEVGQDGITINRLPFQNVNDLIALCAYDYADSMLKIREQTK